MHVCIYAYMHIFIYVRMCERARPPTHNMSSNMSSSMSSNMSNMSSNMSSNMRIYALQHVLGTESVQIDNALKPEYE